MKLYSRIILLLLILQAEVTGFLVYLSFANTVNQNTFALFLTIDLVAFASVTYIYRTERIQIAPNRKWIIVGSAIMIAVFISSLILN